MGKALTQGRNVKKRLRDDARIRKMRLNHPWHDISPGDESPRIVNAVIEIPRDSQQKYELDKESGILKLDRFLYSAVYYPGDYGFIPQTLWEDGDPLDIIILTNRPVYPLTLVRARVIGVIRMIDENELDDKIIGVYDSDPRFKEYNSLKDIPKHVVAELKHFFETYKELQLQSEKVTVPEILDREKAWEDVEISKEKYRRHEKSLLRKARIRSHC
jgi:inorganic pyrophosphatase